MWSIKNPACNLAQIVYTPLYGVGHFEHHFLRCIGIFGSDRSQRCQDVCVSMTGHRIFIWLSRIDNSRSGAGPVVVRRLLSASIL